jgi:hypothetical protein
VKWGYYANRRCRGPSWDKTQVVLRALSAKPRLCEVALKISKIAWLTISLLITAVLTATYNTTTQRDNDIVLGYLLIVLTFPTGSALLACGGFLLNLFSIAAIPGGRLGMLLTSAALLSAGYLQWFILLPALWRLAKKRLGKHT